MTESPAFSFTHEEVQRLKADDQETWAHAFTEIFWMLTHYLRYHLANAPEGDQEDLASQAILKIYTEIDTLKYIDEIKFKGWIYAIIRNLRNDYIRNKSRRKTFAAGDLFLPRKFQARLETEELFEDLEKQELYAQLEQAFGELTQEQQDILFRHYFEGQEYRDIAKSNNANVATIRSLSHRAKAKLREHLAAYFEDAA
jgi:RNA polymerase sigma factor (sigma-70 family)